MSAPPQADLLCFSHLRWEFVVQRPQHLMSRAARTRRVFFFQEPGWTDPAWSDGGVPRLETEVTPEGVVVARPMLPNGIAWDQYDPAMRALLDGLVTDYGISTPVLWFYTPHALDYAGHIKGCLTVYDCMDELSAFQGADPALPARERALMARSDLVFTGGRALFEAKRQAHPRVHCFPSGVDVEHFAPARGVMVEPEDQRHVPHPRAGFYGVLDERLDLELLAAVADMRPQVRFVLLGPVAKIDPASLPQRANLHYLGQKPYDALPGYVAHWDVAMMPFALNSATRFISPTKTPEYLAAGLPVVSTPVQDVVREYGAPTGVTIAASAAEFAAAIDGALAGGRAWWPVADQVLAGKSWDGTWDRMEALMVGVQAPMVMRRARYDAVVVGAGFAGSVVAERLAAGSGQRVLVVDRRPHVGGNAYDAPDAEGVLIHPYGPHIFHTNSDAVVAYLSRFTAWRPYEHRVLAKVATGNGDMLLPVPINRTTVNRFFGLSLTESEVAAFLAAKAEARPEVRTAEDVVISTVGRALYQAMFQGYTRKQWGLDPSLLDKSVTARIPTRTDDDDRYFQDRFQAMPRDGYTRMFERMLDHPNIDVATSTEWRELGAKRSDHLVYTGPIDAYFDGRYGALPYRSLRFEHRTVDADRVQDVAVINYPDAAVPYTRITEFKHLTGQVHAKTSLCTEFPEAEGDPYYPVPRPENQVLYRRYQALADATAGVTFVGRLATYRYYNMDQVVGQALTAYERLKTGRTMERSTALAAE